MSAPARTVPVSDVKAAQRRARRRHSLSERSSSELAEEETPLLRLCRQWWNDWLSQRGIVARDLPCDVRSGELAISLAEILTGTQADQHHSKPARDQERKENLLAAITLLRRARVPLVSANGSEREVNSLPEAVDAFARTATQLAAGQPGAVCSLTWSLILHIDVRTMPEVSSSAALADLLDWARRTTDGYAGIEIGRTRYAWSSCFADGLAWCALLHAHDPSLIPYSTMTCDDVEPETRLRAVFEAARARLGVPELITRPSDVHDPRVAIAYTAALRSALNAAADQRELDEQRSAALAAERQRASASCAPVEATNETERGTPDSPRPPPERMTAHSKAWELRRRRAALLPPGGPASAVLRMSSIDRFGMAV